MRLIFVVPVLIALAHVGGNVRAAETAKAPAGVTTRITGAGVFFADAKGMTLYTYARDDKPGKSACIDDCLKIWPPLVAADDAKDDGHWSVIVREEGTRQWAYRGKPLYTYVRDNYPGGAFGDRLGNAWSAVYEPVVVPPGLAIRALYVGRVLTDLRGMTLYTREDEAQGAPKCEAACLETWLPLAAPHLANAIGDWTLQPRKDATLQWAYQGKRLYLNANDLKPGDLRGNGADKIWRAAILEPAAALPAWVTVQRSDMGEVFADAKGHTLYVFNGSMEKTLQLVCNTDCMTKNWRTVSAEADAAPSGDWAAVSAPDGTRRWAYKGNVVYTHSRDRAPGAIGGDKWAAGAGGGGGGFTPILRRRDYQE
jgi:predicted lipoprotein with Yx(FWY)xxD motif